MFIPFAYGLQVIIMIIHVCICAQVHCILGNFRGTKFSRMGPFHEQIFEDGHIIIINKRE